MEKMRKKQQMMAPSPDKLKYQFSSDNDDSTLNRSRSLE